MKQREVRWELMFPDELNAALAEVSGGVHALWVVRAAWAAKRAGV